MHCVGDELASQDFAVSKSSLSPPRKPPSKPQLKTARGILLFHEERAVVLTLFKECNTITTVSVKVGHSCGAVPHVGESGQVRGGARRHGPKLKSYGLSLRLL